MADLFELSESQIRQILAQFEPFPSPAWTLHPAPRGFSGARLFRVQTPQSQWALRATAVPRVPPDLDRRHAWLGQLASHGLSFIPTPARTRLGDSWVHDSGLLFELTRWQTGHAGWNLDQKPARWQSAAEAIARFHRQSAFLCGDGRGPSTGVARRLQRLEAGSLQNVAQTRAAVQKLNAPELKPLLAAAVDRLQQLRPLAVSRLEPWVKRSVRLQMIHGDLWEDHLLFEGDRVSGLIDFANSRVDHPAWDWARLVESSGPRLTNPGQWVGACQAAAGQPQGEDDELFAILRATAPAAGLETWLRWLLVERRHLTADPRVAARLRALLGATE